MVEKRLQGAGGVQANGESDGGATDDPSQRLVEYQRTDVGRRSPQRHSDTELLRALGDEVADDPGESNGGQGESDRCEKRQQHGVKARTGRELADARVERFNFDREFRIQAIDFCANQRRDGAGVTRRTEAQKKSPASPIRMVAQQHVVFWIAGMEQPRVQRVPSNTTDGHPPAIGHRARADPLADGILAGIEAPCQCLVNNHQALRRLAISFSEWPPADNRQRECLEIVGRHHPHRNHAAGA